jgi:hypothetical protein
VLSAIPEWQRERDDYNLFQSRLGDSAGIDFNKYALCLWTSLARSRRKSRFATRSQPCWTYLQSLFLRS